MPRLKTADPNACKVNHVCIKLTEHNIFHFRKGISPKIRFSLSLSLSVWWAQKLPAQITSVCCKDNYLKISNLCVRNFCRKTFLRAKTMRKCEN